MKRLILLIATAAAALTPAAAQVVTTSPAIVQTDSRNIVITFHADRGNRGLAGIGSNQKIYAHTGVITNESTSPSDWQYAPAWGDNSAKYQMTYAGPDTWTLTIPDINTFYGITKPGVTVEKLTFVFRNADSSREGKGEGGTDIFVDVLPAGFQLVLTSTLSGPVVTDSAPVTFTAYTTSPADISIYYNSTDNTLASASGVTTLTGTAEFTATGDYTVYATARTAAGSVTKSVSLVRTGQSAEAPYPGGSPRMGAVAMPDGSVTFCLAAPGKSNVMLVGSWDGYKVSAASVMSKTTVGGIPYFWTTVKGISDGRDYIYYFLVDGNTPVGDPYARLVLDPWNDRYISSDVFPDMPLYPSDAVQNTPVAVFNSSMDDYAWRVTSFKGVAQSDLIIYELLIRDFTGTEGQSRGEGTVQGVIGKLDYLEELGVNAIELLPIMEFNGNNSWGYNTNFYFAPDKTYGTPDDYRLLIDEAHRRGMAVILDIVFNQSDGLHPWYMMYPIASNPFYNGSAPHAYSVLNDWNQDYPLVQQQWKDALKYWMTAYKVDGFRFDLVKGLGNNDSYGNTYNPATNMWGTPSDANTNRFNATRVARMKELHAAMKEVNPDAYFINENLAGAQEENDMAADGEINWANINTESRQFAMGYSSNSSLNRFYAPLDSRTWGSTVSYAESHDEERMAYSQLRNGATGIRGNIPNSMRRLGSVAAQMLMTPGAHMIWQFQEFGADQTTKNGSGNDTSPKKVVWSYLNNANRAGLRQNYLELCHIRSMNADMFTSDVTTTVSCDSWNGRSIALVKGSKAIYMVVNPSTTAQARVSAPVNLSSNKYKLLSCSYNTTPQPTSTGVILPAGAYAVYGTLDCAGTGDDIMADSGSSIRIYGDYGRIVVVGDAVDVRAYTLTGRRVPLSGLDPGVYIVRADNSIAKVTVR